MLKFDSKGRVSRLITFPPSIDNETGRWLMERYGVAYYEHPNTPTASAWHIFRHRSPLPILVNSDFKLKRPRGMVEGREGQPGSSESLIPESAERQADIDHAWDEYNGKLGDVTATWAYYYLLQDRPLVTRLFTHGVSSFQKVLVRIMFPIAKFAMKRSLKANPQGAAQALVEIHRIFDAVAAKLSDGRRYLLGDRFTLADLFFGAAAAPLVLPKEHGALMPTLDDLPNEMRTEVEKLQQHPAGQYVFRLYREERHLRLSSPSPLKEPGLFGRLNERFQAWLVGPGPIGFFYAILRRIKPVFRFGSQVFVARHSHVTEVLSRDQDFTIAEINAERTERDNGPFVLAMDRSEQHEREKALLNGTIRREDLEIVRGIVRTAAGALIEESRPSGSIDLVNEYARVCATKVVADYFGVPGPDRGTMMDWMRALFHDLFLNLTNKEDISEKAVAAFSEMRPYLEGWIQQVKQKVVSGADLPDTVLVRMLKLQQDATYAQWLDDETIRRNVSGNIVGAVDTTTTALCNVMDVLLKHPNEMAAAARAAENGDIETVRRYAYEALRFKPHNPILLRHSQNKTKIGGKYTIPAGKTVVSGTQSAMFDPDVFKDPKKFDPNREAEYLHFGYGMHACQGRYINGVQIPELVAALLRLKNLRRAPGRAGRIIYDGPFPGRFYLQFDR